MKTIEQIRRYVALCSFPKKDWERVLDYCRENYGGGKIHKSKHPISSSTYKKFINWIQNGFGAGDLVSYGKTEGIVNCSTPDKITLAAYYNFDGELVINEMEVLNPDRLEPLNEERSVQFKKSMANNNVQYYVNSGMIDESFIPAKVCCVRIDGTNDIGWYLGKSDGKYHFAAFIKDGEPRFDCYIPCDEIFLKPGSRRDEIRLFQITSAAGYVYSDRYARFNKALKRGLNNVYYYVNDRFLLTLDRDNGTKKHDERYNAGNYFIDPNECALFVEEIRKLREDKHC